MAFDVVPVTASFSPSVSSVTVDLERRRPIRVVGMTATLLSPSPPVPETVYAANVSVADSVPSRPAEVWVSEPFDGQPTFSFNADGPLFKERTISSFLRPLRVDVNESPTTLTVSRYNPGNPSYATAFVLDFRVFLEV